jgi:hypothetical protein
MTKDKIYMPEGTANYSGRRYPDQERIETFNFSREHLTGLSYATIQGIEIFIKNELGSQKAGGSEQLSLNRREIEHFLCALEAVEAISHSLFTGGEKVKNPQSKVPQSPKPAMNSVPIISISTEATSIDPLKQGQEVLPVKLSAKHLEAIVNYSTISLKQFTTEEVEGRFGGDPQILNYAREGLKIAHVTQNTFGPARLFTKSEALEMGIEDVVPDRASKKS